MAMTFRVDRTELLVVDPYYDFISEGGKLWPRVREVVEANGCVPHMIEILHAARSAGVRVFPSPHRRWRPSDYETWTFWAPIQEAAAFTNSSCVDREDQRSRRMNHPTRELRG
jgi:hypothetical protein